MAGNEEKARSNDEDITLCDVEVFEVEISTTSVETHKSRDSYNFHSTSSNNSVAEIMNKFSPSNGKIAPVSSPRGFSSPSNEIVLKDFEEEEILNQELQDATSKTDDADSGIAASDITGLLEQFLQYEQDVSSSHEENILNFPTPAASPSDSRTEQKRFPVTQIQCKQIVEVVEPTPPITPTCSQSSLESLDKKSLSDDSCSGICLGEGDVKVHSAKEDPLENMENCLPDQVATEEGEICDEAEQANLTSPQHPISIRNGSLANAPLLNLLASKARLITNSRGEKYKENNRSFDWMSGRTRIGQSTDDKSCKRGALSSEEIEANIRPKVSSDSELKGDSRRDRRSSSGERRMHSNRRRSQYDSSSSSRSRSRSRSPDWRRSRGLNKSTLPARSEKRSKSTSRSPVRTSSSRKSIPSENRPKCSMSRSRSRSRSPPIRSFRPRSRSCSRSRSRSASRTPSPRRSGWERSPKARSSVRQKRFCTRNGYRSKCCSKLRGRRSSVSSVDSCSSCSCCDDISPKNSKNSRLSSPERHEKGAGRSRKRTYSSMSDDDHISWSKKMARLDDVVKGSESDMGSSTRPSARRRQPQGRTKPPPNKFRFSFNKNYDEDVHKKMTELAAPVPYDIEKERKLKFLLGNERDSADFQRRNVYAGGIPNGSAKRDIERRFDCFGPIEKITLHFRERGDNYAFIVFKYPEDAARAIRDGNEDPYSRKLDLCFGGRRKFVGGSYVDFDGNASYLHQMDSGNCQQSRSPSPEMDFDSLLKMAREDVGK